MSLASVFSGSDFLTEKPAIACSRSSLYYLHPHLGVLAELWGPWVVVWGLWLGEQALGSVNEGIHPVFTVYKVNPCPITQDPQWRKTKLIIWFSEWPTPGDTVASHRTRELCAHAMGIMRCTVMSIFSSSVLSFTRGFSLLGKCCGSQKQCTLPRAQCTEEALEKLAIFCSRFQVEIQMYHPFEYLISTCYYFYSSSSLTWPCRW